MVAGRSGVLQVGQPLLQAGLGPGGRLERQDHVVHGVLGIHRAQLPGGGEGRKHVAAPFQVVMAMHRRRGGGLDGDRDGRWDVAGHGRPRGQDQGEQGQGRRTCLSAQG